MAWGERLLATFVVTWHLRRLPPGPDAEGRSRRWVWCRDHGDAFAGRWFLLGAGLWLLFTLVGALLPVPVALALAVCALVAMLVGTGHVALQVYAQSRVGLPPIDPPVSVPRPGKTARGDRVTRRL